MSFLKEMFLFLKSQKKLWLFPIVITIILIGALFIAAQGTVFATFVYTLF